MYYRYDMGKVSEMTWRDRLTGEHFNVNWTEYTDTEMIVIRKPVNDEWY